MNIVSAFITFSMIWWLVFFMMLPVGVSVGRNPEIGHASSAPKEANMKQKIKQTTLITSFLFILAYVVISRGWLGVFVS